MSALADGQDVYVTKYALSKGIVKTTVQRGHRDGASYTVRWPGGLNGVLFLHYGYCFATKEEALADAEKQRVKKVASLEKQLAKIRIKKIRVVAARE